MSLNVLRVVLTATIVFVAAILMVPFLIESNNASQVLVITRPNGVVDVYDAPGWHWQGFGTPVHYSRRATIAFPLDKAPLSVRFNDSGTAKLGGILNYELNGDKEQIKQLHSQFLTPESVQDLLIKSHLGMAAFSTGSLLSSTESYSSSRGLMLELIQDQIEKGIYATDGSLVKEVDNLGLERTLTKIRIRKDKDGNNVIAAASPLKKFGITCQLNIKDIEYDEKVNAQIQAQLDATIKVQTGIAEAKRAEQDKITAEQKGLAAKAEAEADANVKMATATIAAEQQKTVAVTEAEQKKEVAALGLEEAKLLAQAVIEQGKADAEAAKLKMEADGALKMKLETYAKVQNSWAVAYANSTQPHSPAVVMAGQGEGGNNAVNLLELIGAKAAMDLGISLKQGEKK